MNPLGGISPQTLVENINSTVLWAIFILVTIIYAIISGVLIYHWRKFGYDSKKVAIAEFIYIALSILLLIGAATAASFY